MSAALAGMLADEVRGIVVRETLIRHLAGKPEAADAAEPMLAVLRHLRLAREELETARQILAGEYTPEPECRVRLPQPDAHEEGGCL